MFWLPVEQLFSQGCEFRGWMVSQVCDMTHVRTSAVGHAFYSHVCFPLNPLCWLFVSFFVCGLEATLDF